MVWIERFEAWAGENPRNHAGHAFASHVLAEIEGLVPAKIQRSLETGCGKSTIVFSNISDEHIVFSIDDTAIGFESSVNFYRDCPVTNLDSIVEVFGPSQRTLPRYRHTGHYDVVLLDGPHGFPFPEVEYYFVYPHVRKGGFLIIDDTNIPTIGRMADIISEDPMWEMVALVEATLVLKRTDSPTFDPDGDGWWLQRYNRRRVSRSRDIFMSDGPVREAISDRKLDEAIHPPRRFRNLVRRVVH